MIQNILQDAKLKMTKSIDHLKQELSTVRTGRASASLLDSIKVDYYGTLVPLKNIAHVSTPEPQSLLIQPFDTSSFEAIEKSIIESDTGLTPNNDGNVIRINIPLLTEERRIELNKLVSKMSEEGRVSIRNIRRDVNDQLKKLEKDEGLSIDEIKRALDDVQKVTDNFINDVNSILSNKEKEILL
ncbi:MAG: ribosome recycling factor [Candidatus Marinimicrobia bacterium]|nr:ribosome recycling factor [Candidatus Neomarinimicrobiota bacterium]|tara:strand:+ start:6121 stop:6675 length:555 start_codon:yes stop_codon:yes gene_type:complete